MKENRSATLGFLAGFVGGALGTLALNVFQTASIKTTGKLEGVRLSDSYTRQQRDLLHMFERAHLKTAEAVVEGLGGELSRKQRKAAVPVTEFAFGILCAGLYGAAAEYVPEVTAGFGTVYGAALFTGASLLVLPAIGFVPSPAERTPVQHAGGMAGNVLYGAITEGVRRLLR